MAWPNPPPPLPPPHKVEVGEGGIPNSFWWGGRMLLTHRQKERVDQRLEGVLQEIIEQWIIHDLPNLTLLGFIPLVLHPFFVLCNV